MTPAERAAIETDLAKYAGMFGPHDPVTYARALLAALTTAEAALLDILGLSKGEPRMGGGSSFPANGHRMGRIHNRARAAFGEEPLTILPREATRDE